LLEDHHEGIPSSLSLPSYTRLSEPATADLGETAHEKTVSDSDFEAGAAPAQPRCFIRNQWCIRLSHRFLEVGRVSFTLKLLESSYRKRVRSGRPRC